MFCLFVMHYIYCTCIILQLGCIYMYPIYFLVGILTLGLIGIACGVLIIRGKNKPLKYVITGFLTVLINIILFFF